MANNGSEDSSEQCINGEHYVMNGDVAQHVGQCDNAKHQVVNAALQAGQASQGQPQTGNKGMDYTKSLFPMNDAGSSP